MGWIRSRPWIFARRRTASWEPTTDYDRPVGGIEWREGISSGSISYGLEIVDIEGLEQQGLKICYLASKQDVAGQKAYETRTIYWDCGAWKACQ